jgi:hypothetical protein
MLLLPTVIATLSFAGADDVVAQCYSYLESHEVSGVSAHPFSLGKPFHYYRPALTKYGPEQWLWDSAAHMTAWSHRNVTNALLDMRTMLSMQRADGRVPEQLYWADGDTSSALQYSEPCCADLTQMPVLPFALRAILNASAPGDVPALARELVPPLVAYFRWWRDTREVDKDGLVAILHGWESGLDASPAYDEAYGLPRTKLLNSSLAVLELYPKFDELPVAYKARYAWNQSAILQRKQKPSGPAELLLDSWFIVKDVGVNSVLAAGWGVLADLAERGGLSPSVAAEARSEQARVGASIVRKMWDAGRGHFVTLYRDAAGAERAAEAETVQSLFPLLLPALPPSITAAVLASLKNTSKFWLPFPLPSAAADAAAFNPVFTKTIDLMWRGPTWAYPNWIVMEGLWQRQQAGTCGDVDCAALGDEMLDRWLALYEQNGVWEMYNPVSGAGYGEEGLGMSTLIVDWLVRMGRVSV